MNICHNAFCLQGTGKPSLILLWNEDIEQMPVCFNLFSRWRQSDGGITLQFLQVVFGDLLSPPVHPIQFFQLSDAQRSENIRLDIAIAHAGICIVPQLSLVQQKGVLIGALFSHDDHALRYLVGLCDQGAALPNNQVLGAVKAETSYVC